MKDSKMPSELAPVLKKQAVPVTASKESDALSTELKTLRSKVKFFEKDGAVKGFVVAYESSVNCFSGKKLIVADNIGDAQDEFFVWLKKQEVYAHMWQLNITISEVAL